MKNIVGMIVFCLLTAIVAAGVSSVSDDSVQVTSMFPMPGSENVPAVRIQIAFDRPVDANTMVLDVLATQPDGSPIYVAGAIEVNERRTAIVFRSYRPLPAGEIQVRSVLHDGITHDWKFTVTEKMPSYQGRGGPILLVLGEGAPFGKYLSEILQAEGFTNFRTLESSSFRPSALAEHRLVLTAGKLPVAAVVALENWVSAGGNLIAFRPSDEMADLAGLRTNGEFLSGGDLAIDTKQAPGQGLVDEAIQFHGIAERYSPKAGTRTLAALSDDRSQVTAPALTLRELGNTGGEVAAFAFDLAQSVVLTRQGNFLWAGQDRDGLAPIRPNDLFFGSAANDPQPDFLDVSRARIPQADEQMRLLTNLIQHMQRDDAPIPRFWYFPKRYKAVFVMAADDHGTKRGTSNSFDRLLSLDDDDCDVSKWECARATAWLYPQSGLSAWAAKYYAAAGFDIGSHASTFCKNWSRSSLDLTFASDILRFRSAYPGLPAQAASRLHCIVWSDFTSQAEIGRNWGIRFDMNYYYWPKTWIKGRAGFMTGSGVPMRFSTADGDLINVYQQETHLVDEIFNDERDAVEALVLRALGPEQFFGAFGTHYDFHNTFDRFLMDLAKKHDIPMISARQMLDWQDGRSRTDILDQKWDGENLEFQIVADGRTHDMLTTMLPSSMTRGNLLELTRDGVPIPVKTEVLKGVEYALFPGTSGNYRATYGSEIVDNAGTNSSQGNIAR